ncbi:MAG TPA: hydrogenase maturation nickel metallochaperone HypA [Candidatus Nanopelagicales bacterium]
MHELAMAQGVVRTVVAALPEPAPRVARVRLRVGALAGITPDGLRLTFEVAAAGSPLDGSELQVEVEPLAIDCPACGLQPLADAPSLACPTCGATGSLVGDAEVHVVGVTLLTEEVAG